MQYNLSTQLDKERFKKRVNALYSKGAVVELCERTLRTSNQNSYLHLIIGVVAMECGTTLEYAKTEYFKRLCNAPLFAKEVQDKFIGTLTTLRSSAELTKDEMSTAIDRFKMWASEQGIYLPEPEDTDTLADIAVEMGRYERYL